jgi:hypothetical protein
VDYGGGLGRRAITVSDGGRQIAGRFALGSVNPIRRAERSFQKLVMPGLDPGIHAFAASKKDVDGRDEARP